MVGVSQKILRARRGAFQRSPRRSSVYGKALPGVSHKTPRGRSDFVENPQKNLCDRSGTAESPQKILCVRSSVAEGPQKNLCVGTTPLKVCRKPSA
jgi:hypothetical protein